MKEGDIERLAEDVISDVEEEECPSRPLSGPFYGMMHRPLVIFERFAEERSGIDKMPAGTKPGDSRNPND